MCTVVIFSGDYDLHVRDELRTEFEDLIAEPNVVLDFSAVTFFDSTCIAELVRMHGRRAARGGTSETLIAGSPLMRRLFDVLQLHRIMNVVDSLDEAIGRCGIPARIRYAFAGTTDASLVI